VVDSATSLGDLVFNGRSPTGAFSKAAAVSDDNVFGQSEAAQTSVGSHRFAVNGFFIIGHNDAEIDIALIFDGGPFGLGAEEVDLLWSKFNLKPSDNFVGLF
jgi:hypothetical protein